MTYRVYCREMSVRTNWVEADFAMLNGASTFLTPADAAPRPHDIRIELAPGWTESVTALPPAPDGRPHSYRAADFDTLVDSPILTGNPATYAFTVEGTPHALVNVGEGGVWDGPTAAADVERIVREQHRTWGFFPYERYLFLNMLVEASGGLEHRNSTLLMTSRWITRDRRRYLRWLGTVSHELFHAWNVKQLRPAALGPFDYEREAFTPSLWMVEGLTSYYGPLAVHRAGISTREEFLEALSGQIEALQTTPGRLVQPVVDASYDAWIKYYRRNENSPNTTISYYTKGAVIGFLLDARVREATGGQRSLDDVLKAAYARYSGERGFRPGEFEAVASAVAGVDLGGWFDRAVRSTDELDYGPALAWYGLEFAPDARGDEDAPAPAWLGLGTRVDRGRLLVAGVRRGTPGYEAGFNVGDEILAIGDYRVGPEAWRQRLDLYRAGDAVTILVARRERLMRLDARFGEPPAGALAAAAGGIAVCRAGAASRRLARLADGPEYEPASAQLRDQQRRRVDRVLPVRLGVLMVTVVHDDDVAARNAGGEPVRKSDGIGTAVPVEVPQAPAPANERVAGPGQPHVHLPAPEARVGTKGAAGPAAAQVLDSLRRTLQAARHLVGREHHPVARMRMEADGMPFVEHAADYRRRPRGEVSVDHEEGRACLLLGEHVEQQRRRGRVRAVVESQVDDRRTVPLRHAPDRRRRGDGVEQKRKGRDVGKRQQAEAGSDQQPEHRLGRWRVLLACAGAVLGCALGPGESASVAEERTARQDDRSGERQQMVERQIRARGISTPAVLEALAAVPRHRFVPAELAPRAYDDTPLPIGYDQTISQPYVVAFMTEAAALTPDTKVLDIGTGSGYQAAVLAEIVGQVYSIEIVPDLAERSRRLLADLGYGNVQVRTGDGYRGWPDEAPFDAIVVAAAPDHVPPALVEQLAVGARLVIPVGRFTQEILIVTKTADGSTTEAVLPVRFVPMTGEAQRPRR